MTPSTARGQRRGTPARRRLLLVATALVLGLLGWAAKVAVENTLAAGGSVDLGLLELRLTYNSGVAFSLGAGLPTAVVVAGTGLIAAVIAGYAWFTAPEIGLWGLFGLAAIVAGATTNLLDRAADGAVTDYLHTGWFATFNVPDALISVGAVVVAASMLFAPEQRSTERRADPR